MITWPYMKYQRSQSFIDLDPRSLRFNILFIFSLETAKPIEAKFHLYPQWDGEYKFVQMVQVTWPIWPPCLYMIKTFKNLLLWNQKGWWPWDLVCSIGCWSTTKFIQMMTLGWPWPILRQDQIWSIMLFYWKRVKQWIFQKLFKSMISKLVNAVN